mmetsp:Transcript_32950/g.77808  ORF Transcript_32950/g.77808 Transcript_32950/m.77808 type:complete len:159 (+) Transcript_32950:295-771(+)
MRNDFVPFLLHSFQVLPSPFKSFQGASRTLFNSNPHDWIGSHVRWDYARAGSDFVCALGVVVGVVDVVVVAVVEDETSSLLLATMTSSAAAAAVAATTVSREAEKRSRATGGFAPVTNAAMQSPISGPNLKARPLPPEKTATLSATVSMTKYESSVMV